MVVHERAQGNWACSARDNRRGRKPEDMQTGVKMARFAIAVIVLAAALFGFFKTRALRSEDFKIQRFGPCPDKPNCVSSDLPEADPRHFAALPFTKSPTEAKKSLRERVESLDRVKLTEDSGNYLRYEFRSTIFGFIDDVEFEFNETTKQVRVRSASRIGHSDFGVNRKRLEKIQTLLNGQI
jgi:uncharacterized protein (DUF1499 family)